MNYPNDTNGASEAPEIPESIRAVLTGGLDMKLHLVRHHAQLPMLLVREILDEEMTQLTGEKHARDKPLGPRTPSGVAFGYTGNVRRTANGR
ncbi:MAG: hypothetical protein ACI80V_002274 [Rhodothermales bacterium]|jgi:hypothetical protein